jgi:hypothetical protein
MKNSEKIEAALARVMALVNRLAQEHEPNPPNLSDVS